MKPGKAVLRYYGAAWWNQKAILWTLDIFWFLAFVFLVAISLDAVFFKGNNFRLVLGWASGHPLLLFLWTAVTAPISSFIVLLLLLIVTTPSKTGVWLARHFTQAFIILTIFVFALQSFLMFLGLGDQNGRIGR
ncbi:MAG: hypothetical protein ACREQA_14435 [Candidatus Binatia bacterium]